MRTNKFWIFTTIILLLINIALVYFLYNKKQDARKGGKRGERGDWVVNELKLTDQQKEEHRKIKDAHFNTLKPVFDSITTARLQLYELLKTPNPSDSLVNHYTKIIGEQHARISEYTFDHFREIRAICNPEQQLKLDTIMTRLVKDMGRRGQQRPERK